MASLEQLKVIAEASGDPAAVHGIETLLRLAKDRAEGKPVPQDPVSFAKLVCSTAPPQAKAAFKDQADAVAAYEAGQMSMGELKTRLS